jgi:hypothetical protein
MKKRNLAVVLAVAAVTLSSCGDQSVSKAEAMISKACPEVMKDDANIMKISEASMLDSKWIPLAEAASFFRLNKDSIDAMNNSNFKLELAKAQATILTFCSPYINK